MYFGLVRPYTIASKGTTYEVANMIIEIELENGVKGLGSGAPTELGEGETIKVSEDALQASKLHWLVGKEIESIEELSVELRNIMSDLPASRSAIDIALYDALSLSKNIPLVCVPFDFVYLTTSLVTL